MSSSTTIFDKAAQRTYMRELAQARKTCQGCHWLKLWPRGMCTGEASAHYRNVRDTYHDRCDVYAVRPAGTAAAVTEAEAEGQEYGELLERESKRLVRA